MKAIFSTLAAFALSFSLGVAVMAVPHHPKAAGAATNALSEREFVSVPLPEDPPSSLAARKDEASRYREGHGRGYNHGGYYQRNEAKELAIATRQLSGLTGALGGLSGNGGGIVKSRQVGGLTEALGGTGKTAKGTVKMRQLDGNVPIIGSLLGGRSEADGMVGRGNKKGRSEDEGVEKRQGGPLGDLALGALGSREEKVGVGKI
ncbi:hypothetical protein CPB83DRAFT_861557 [Crepidotus variabilis]|uniref:Uncharacterized protein n=1 Tax=Crepidotus variabilis TaxID=179855 RepID=A0A9P6E7W5_9AGAR|nr:hypothetical protein CPB83DRAFT_861557 [Crepidotus variabilis]